MNISAGEPIKRLLFTDEPLEDESLLSYIMRLAEMNEILDVRWIYKLICPKQIYEYNYKIEFDYKIDPDRLSTLTGIAPEKIRDLLYAPKIEQSSRIAMNTYGSQHIIWEYFLKRENPKICPACLKEHNYCRKIWEYAVITTCPHHKCLLIEQCQGCRQRISWQRPGLARCQCSYDFRQSGIIPLNEKELRLTARLHVQSGLACCSEKPVFAEPINKLNRMELLKLLFFIGSHLTGVRNFSGKHLVMNTNNLKAHLYLCQSVELFDDWARDYHRFLRDSRDWIMDGYFISWRQMYFRHLRLPNEYQDYELFNQMQRAILFEERFSFMHDELLIFLKRTS